MFNIKSIIDIEKIDADLAGLFQRPDEAVNWIYAVEHGIKDWIAKNNKQYWEVVRFVSEQRGILGKYKKDNNIRLTRRDFARVLLKFCPDAIKEGETVTALMSSMEHYQFATELKSIDKQFSDHRARRHIRTVESLLDQKPIIESHEEESKPTLEDLLEKYLRDVIEEPNKDRFPRSKVCIRPQYDGISPAISVETYYSDKLLNDNLPTYVEAYEFVDGVLREDELDKLYGRYVGKYMKLFIVSSSGLLPNVKALAQERHIGYVRLNPNSRMTSDNYILRRIEDHSMYQHDLKVLTGEEPMTTPILIMDDLMLTSSLTDALIERGVAVNSHRSLVIPYLSNDEIEKRADDITKKDIEERINYFCRVSSSKIYPSINPIDNIDLSIDPFLYAKSHGLSYTSKVIEAQSQLALLDVKKKHVTLNAKGLDNYERYRFSMAHEFGHYILHSDLFKKQGVASVGESPETLSLSANNLHRLEYQANLFASYLLMPKALVAIIYERLFETKIHRVYGDTLRPLYYSPKQSETWPSYNNVVVKMASILGVSQQALIIRLKSLGLLNMPNDSRFYNFSFRNKN